MPFCPQCKGEYLEHIEVCIHCDVKLVEKLSDEELRGYRDINLQPICKVDDFSEAYLVKGLLEGEHIEVFIKPNEVVMYDGVCFPMESIWGLIYVAEENVEKGRQIIADYLAAESTQDEPSFSEGGEEDEEDYEEDEEDEGEEEEDDEGEEGEKESEE